MVTLTNSTTSTPSVSDVAVNELASTLTSHGQSNQSGASTYSPGDIQPLVPTIGTYITINQDTYISSVYTVMVDSFGENARMYIFSGTESAVGDLIATSAGINVGYEAIEPNEFIFNTEIPAGNYWFVMHGGVDIDVLYQTGGTSFEDLTLEYSFGDPIEITSPTFGTKDFLIHFDSYYSDIDTAKRLSTKTTTNTGEFGILGNEERDTNLGGTSIGTFALITGFNNFSGRITKLSFTYRNSSGSSANILVGVYKNKSLLYQETINGVVGGAFKQVDISIPRTDEYIYNGEDLAVMLFGDDSLTRIGSSTESSLSFQEAYSSTETLPQTLLDGDLGVNTPGHNIWFEHTPTQMDTSGFGSTWRESTSPWSSTSNSWDSYTDITSISNI